MNSAQQRCHDKGEESVANDTHRLEERARKKPIVSTVDAEAIAVSYMLPPRSLICAVTTASPIQIRAKTPEKTTVFCSDDAVMESSRLSNKQKISGPLSSG